MKCLVRFDLTGNQLINVVAENLTTAQINALSAADKKAGRFLFDTTAKTLQYWDGTAWVALSARDDVAGAITAALADLNFSMEATTGWEVVSQVTQENGKVVAVKRTLDIVNALRDAKDEAVAKAIRESELTIVKNGNSYTFSQGGEALPVSINIPKDMVVESGSIVIGNWSGDTFTPSASGTGKALALVIANGGGTVYIDVADLVDVYTAGTTGNVTISISADNKITASLQDESIKLSHLTDHALNSLTTMTLTAPTASDVQAQEGPIDYKTLFQTVVNNLAYLFDSVAGRTNYYFVNGFTLAQNPIMATTHGCGQNPIVQVRKGNQIVLTTVEITSGNIKVAVPNEATAADNYSVTIIGAA